MLWNLPTGSKHLTTFLYIVNIIRTQAQAQCVVLDLSAVVGELYVGMRLMLKYGLYHYMVCKFYYISIKFKLTSKCI